MIHIVDSEMGSGKTSAMINQMNENPSVRFLFITQLIEEVERIYNACPAFRKTDTGWIDGYGLALTKTESLIKYLEDGVSIAATHALFSMMTDEILDLFNKKEYVLVCDETIQTIERLDETSKNISLLLRKNILSVDENRNVQWMDDSYLEDRSFGYYDSVAIECRKGGISLESDRGNNVLMRYMNPKYFTSFKDVFILTYRFGNSPMDGWCRINHIDYDMWQACRENNQYMIKPGRCNDKINKKINLICNDKINDIGYEQYALSHNWYVHRGGEGNDDIRKIRNNLRMFFENRCHRSSVNTNLYTTFKGFETMVSGKGYSAKYCFVPFNTRATNKQQDKTNVAFLVNRFMSPAENRFYKRHEVDVSEDNVALNDMIQFVWRSAVRNGKPINLYIPSKRMRDLFVEWFDSVNETPIETNGEEIKYFYQGAAKQ